VKKISLHFLWKDQSAPRRYPTAVSLHGHTLHSWENLRFLHSFKLPLPLIPAVLRVAGWQHRRRHRAGSGAGAGAVDSAARAG
jgi:hypothetical protein